MHFKNINSKFESSFFAKSVDKNNKDNIVKDKSIKKDKVKKISKIKKDKATVKTDKNIFINILIKQ